MNDKVERTRNWAGILYPESAPENWREIAKNEILTPIYVSPLHHGFSDGKLDEDRKDHYHILVTFDGVKTRKQVTALLEKLGVVMIIQVDNLRVFARYLCHLDDEDKEQFGDYLSEISVYHTSLRSYLNLCESTEDRMEERLDIISDILEFIDEWNVTSFYNLLMYAKSNNRDWFRVLISNGAYVINQAIRAKDGEV